MKKLLIVLVFALLPLYPVVAQQVTLPHLSKEGKEFKEAIDQFKHQVNKYIGEAKSNPSSGPAICRIVQDLAEYSLLSQAYEKYSSVHEDHLKQLKVIQNSEARKVKATHGPIFLGVQISHEIKVSRAAHLEKALLKEKVALFKYLNRPTEVGWLLSTYIIEHLKECPDLSEEFVKDAKGWKNRLEEVEFGPEQLLF